MTPKIDPQVADVAPWSETLTDYDREHLVTYLRLLDAARDGADWDDASRVILGRGDPASARPCWESHMRRAEWMTKAGYQHLLAARRPQDLE